MGVDPHRAAGPPGTGGVNGGGGEEGAAGGREETRAPGEAASRRVGPTVGGGMEEGGRAGPFLSLHQGTSGQEGARAGPIPPMRSSPRGTHRIGGQAGPPGAAAGGTGAACPVEGRGR